MPREPDDPLSVIHPSQWQQQTQQLKQIKNWQLAGRVGIRLADQAHSATIQWRQQDQHFEIALLGPLGQGGAKIKGHREHVTITDASSGHRQHGHPDSLMQNQLGYALPIQDLAHWCRGLIPRQKLVKDLQFNSHGLPESFQQGVWQVNYLRWQPISSSSRQPPIYLPRKLILQSPQVKISLLIKQWHLEADSAPESRLQSPKIGTPAPPSIGSIEKVSS